MVDTIGERSLEQPIGGGLHYLVSGALIWAFPLDDVLELLVVDLVLNLAPIQPPFDTEDRFILASV